MAVQPALTAVRLHAAQFSSLAAKYGADVVDLVLVDPMVSTVCALQNPVNNPTRTYIYKYNII